MRTLLVLLTALSAQLFASEEAPDILMLSSLEKGCRIEKRWYGLIPHQPSAAWLVCRNENFLIQGPANLAGHVAIETSESALEFAYFFSSDSSIDLFPGHGLIGFPPDMGPEDWRSDLKKELLKLGVSFDVAIEKIDQQDCPQKVAFILHRTVVHKDRKVYRVREYIGADGYYMATLESVLHEDIANLGFLFHI